MTRVRTALAVAERVLCAPGTPGGLTLAAGTAIADLVDRWRGVPVCVDLADEDLTPDALALLTRVRRARETGQAADPGRWDSGKEPCRVCGTPTQRRDRSGLPCHQSCDPAAQLTTEAKAARRGTWEDPPPIQSDPRRGALTRAVLERVRRELAGMSADQLAARARTYAALPTSEFADNLRHLVECAQEIRRLADAGRIGGDR